MKFSIPFLFLLASVIVNTVPVFGQNTMVCDTLYIHSGPEGEYDATLYDAMPNDNFSTDPNLIAETWTIGGSPITLRAIFKFNLPNLPAGSTLNSASLHLSYNTTTTHVQGNSYYPGSGYLNPNDGTIYRVNQVWDPLTVTWNNQPTFSYVNAVTVPPSSSQTQGLDINITNLVNDHYNDPNSHGFLFKMNTEMTYRCQVYASSNNANWAEHPSLTICYTPGISSGINEIKESSEVSLYCSNHGQIQITNLKHTPLYEMALYALDGALLERIALNNQHGQQTIHTKHPLVPGFYMVRLHTEKGLVHTKMNVW
ncbi:MAG: DNRLRE domain-containing protein [Chitinophagaceae bacterium]